VSTPALGAKLRAAREAAGLSQRQLAEQLHANQTSLSAWERGARIPPPRRMVEAARILHVDVDVLGDRLNRDGQDAMTCTIRELGAAIREARIAAGLSREQLAEHLGVVVPTIGVWERGYRAPSYERAPSVAAALGLDVKMFPRCKQPRTTVYNVQPGKVQAGTDSLGRPVWRQVVDAKEKLFSRVIAGPGGCVIWTGGKTDRGYGHININGERHYVHRLAYQLLIGPIPEGLELDHLCHTKDRSCPGGRSCPHRRCCNPYHLEPVTSRENSRRSAPARRTHCPKGHEYTEENTRVRVRSGKRSRSATSRECAECNRLRSREAYKAVLERTHCNVGHEMTSENTTTRSDGVRMCRACRSAGSRKPRLTPEQLTEVHRLLSSGERPLRIAALFGVTPTAIRAIAKRRGAVAGEPEPDALLAEHRRRLANTTPTTATERTAA